MKSVFRLLPILAALAFSSCNRRVVVVEDPPIETATSAPRAETRTLETERLAAANDRFERGPNEENRAAVKKALADLQGEIAELEARVARTHGTSRDEAAVKLRNLRDSHAQEDARFARNGGDASIDVSGAPPAPPAEGAGIDPRTGAEKLAEDAKEGARKLGDVIEDAGRKAANAIHDATR